MINDTDQNLIQNEKKYLDMILVMLKLNQIKNIGFDQILVINHDEVEMNDSFKPIFLFQKIVLI